MDNFKNYLQQHLDEMDTDVPGAAVWHKLQTGISPAVRKANPVKSWYQYAAAACVLVLIAAGIIFLSSTKQATGSIAGSVVDSGIKQAENKKNQPQPSAIANNKSTRKTVTPQSITPVITTKDNLMATNKVPVKKKALPADPSVIVMQDVEQNYAQLVNSQLAQLRATPVYAESPDYFSSFKQQLRQIERDEAVLKKDIRQHGLTDKLLQQLINMVQQKLNVLKDLRTEIKKLNTHPAESVADSTQSFYLNM